jgi:type I restriction enzyme M protein
MMEDIIKRGLAEGLIAFNKDESRITYVHQRKERNYNTPEEKVQARTFVKLVLDYNYPVKRK